MDRINPEWMSTLVGLSKIRVHFLGYSLKGIGDSFFCSSISSNHARMARAVNRWMPILLHTGILISDQSD